MADAPEQKQDQPPEQAPEQAPDQAPITTSDVDVTAPEHVYPDPDAVISTSNTEPIPEGEWSGSGEMAQPITTEKTTKEAPKK